MGVFSGCVTRDYWRNCTLQPVHPIYDYMSQIRFEQILRYFHVSDPSIAEENNVWTYKVKLLLEAVYQASMKYYTPQTNVSIDETMVYFCDCSHDIFKIPNKLIDESYKVFYLTDCSYVFDFHLRSCNRKASGIEDTNDLNNTSATVFSLTIP